MIETPTSKTYDHVVTPTLEVCHGSQCIVTSVRYVWTRHHNPTTGGAQVNLPHLRGTQFQRIAKPAQQCRMHPDQTILREM